MAVVLPQEALKSKAALRVTVWDLPTRLFHWLFALSFAVAWFTHEDSRYLDVHVFAGYLMLGLLVFRVAWGLTGNRYARFRAFAFSWRDVWGYLQRLREGRAPRYLSHNPAGSWAVFVLMGLGLLLGVSGLLVLGGEERHGPLAGLLSFEQGALFGEVHEAVALVMLGMVAFHLLGVAVESLVHRENLVAAMIHGRKAAGTPAAGAPRYRGTGLMLLGIALVAAALYFKGYALQTPEQPYRPFVGPTLPDNATWRAECGSCHLAYHPTLLPARSWDWMMDEQGDHFGEDLALDAATLREVREFLLANAAESLLTESAWKILRTTPAAEAPLSITETPYWQRKHREIPEAVWNRPDVQGKGNCAACHLDANEGTFEDGAMRVPSGPPREPAKPAGSQ